MPEEWVKFKQQQTGFTHKHHKRNWQGKERTSLVCIVQSLRSVVSSQEYRVGAPALTKCKALAIKWKHVFLKMQENSILFGCVLMTLWAPRHLFVLKADLGQDRHGEDLQYAGKQINISLKEVRGFGQITQKRRFAYVTFLFWNNAPMSFNNEIPSRHLLPNRDLPSKK